MPHLWIKQMEITLLDQILQAFIKTCYNCINFHQNFVVLEMMQFNILLAKCSKSITFPISNFTKIKSRCPKIILIKNILTLYYLLLKYYGNPRYENSINIERVVGHIVQFVYMVYFYGAASKKLLTHWFSFTNSKKTNEIAFKTCQIWFMVYKY